MARLWSSGFEMQSTSIEGTALVGTPSISTSVFRSGAASLRINPTATTQAFRVNFRADSTNGLYVRFYLYIATATDALDTIMRYDDAALAPGWSVRMNSDRTLELWDEIAAVQVGSDSSALSTNTWYRIEVKYLDVGIGTSTLEGKIDGTTWATTTTAHALAGGGELRIGAATSTTCDLYYDDIAVNDDQGASQNSYPGEGSLALLVPTGAGDNAATKGIYSYINEIPPTTTATSGSTMIELDTNTSIGDYNVTDSSTAGITGTVTLVDVYALIREEAAGTSNYTMRIKSASGATVSSSASVDAGNATARLNPSGTTAHRNKLVAYTDPTTGSAWTTTGTNSIDNMQIGVGTTDGTPDIWCLWLGAYVEYVPSSSPAASAKNLSALGVG